MGIKILDTTAIMRRIGDLGVKTSPNPELPFCPSISTAAQLTGISINTEQDYEVAARQIAWRIQHPFATADQIPHFRSVYGQTE